MYNSLKFVEILQNNDYKKIKFDPYRQFSFWSVNDQLLRIPKQMIPHMKT